MLEKHDHPNFYTGNLAQRSQFTWLVSQLHVEGNIDLTLKPTFFSNICIYCICSCLPGIQNPLCTWGSSLSLLLLVNFSHPFIQHGLSMVMGPLQ